MTSAPGWRCTKTHVWHHKAITSWWRMRCVCENSERSTWEDIWGNSSFVWSKRRVWKSLLRVKLKYRVAETIRVSGTCKASLTLWEDALASNSRSKEETLATPTHKRQETFVTGNNEWIRPTSVRSWWGFGKTRRCIDVFQRMLMFCWHSIHDFFTSFPFYHFQQLEFA